jgi:hypothetical protein
MRSILAQQTSGRAVEPERHGVLFKFPQSNGEGISVVASLAAQPRACASSARCGRLS